MIEKYTNGAWTELAGYKKYGETVFDFSSFPASFQSGGVNMSDYRIYGSSDGVGERSIPYGYQINAVVRSENLFESNDAEHGYYNNGAFVPNSSYICSKAVNVIAGQSYTFSIQSNHSAGCYIQLVYLNANDEYVDITSKTYNYVGTATITGVVPANASKIKAICIISSSEQMLTEGSTAPTQYIPYSRTDTPIYIGDTPLAQGEYVDYSEQKVYKYVGGVLTPTDPPVALPALPTIDGATIVDFDNTPKPSRMTGEAIGWKTLTPKIYKNGAWTEPYKLYGIRIDPDTADPYSRVTYLEDAVGMTPASMGTTAFDYGSWADAFFMPKPCVLNFDGTVAYYLDPNDYSKKIDGTPSNIGDLSIGGNVMLEFPKIYFKYVPNESGRDGEFYVSNHKVDDTYECWCNYDADNNEIDHFYMAAYNGCCYDGKMRSISGLTLAPWVATAYSDSATYAVGDKVNYQSKMYKCITAVETAEAFDPAKWEQYAFNGNIDGVKEMAYARANNATAKDEWLIDLWADAILIWGLLMLMGKTTALQETFGRGIDSGSQAAAEAYVTGSLNDKGLFYGDTVNGSTAVKVFGIENFWGCKWRRCAGFFGTSTGYAYKLTHGTKDGSAVSSFGTSAAGYLAVTAERPASNYVKNMMLGRHGLIAGVTGSPASASAYYCDYFFNFTGFAVFGGDSYYGRYCGLCVSLGGSVSYHNWSNAAALSCKPLKAEGQ